MNKYGVRYFSQTSEFHRKKKKHILFNEIYFDSAWEVLVYKYCIENNFDIVYQPCQLEYQFENKKFYHVPDFRINGKLYEVKGDQFIDSQGNLINPYTKDQRLIAKTEAKNQCMKNNDVIIIASRELQNLKEVIK